LGVDGYPRPKNQDEQISKVIESVFRTPNGMEMMQYLKSITTDAVSGPNISDAELRHLEGQRYLVALIVKRIQHAKRISK
tara:strand:+ start:339 stop:578 length:240 start_codon:yes stop_codon:yes gene_type:complete